MKEMLELLKNFNTEDEINLFVEEVIKFFSNDSKSHNIITDTIGALVGMNPCEDTMNDSNLVYSINSWVGYIPKNMRIVYGNYTDNYNRCYTKGSYYYLDDESYVYEFVKYLKDKEIDDIDDFVLYVYMFLKSFLEKYFDYPHRDDLHKLIYRTDNENYYKPTKEHSIRDFYHNGSAMCTEYSVMGNNLLSIFGIEVAIVMDKQHAFNLLVYDGKGFIIDFSDMVIIKDLNDKRISSIPFFEEIEEFDEEMAKRIIYNSERICCDDYEVVHVGAGLYKRLTGLKREYGVDYEKVETKSIIL